MEKKPYIPYGYEWEAEMMKLPKKELIGLRICAVRRNESLN